MQGKGEQRMSTANDVQLLYVGYLGRAADQGGLDYWVNEIDSGVLTLEQLRANLTNEQPEYLNEYGGLTRTQLVAQIYENLFERTPSAGELDYWVNGGGGAVNADQLIVAFINAASIQDQLVLDNKLQVANHYTEVLGGPETFNISDAGAAVDDVDGTFESVIAAKAAIDGGYLTDGETFVLTATVDEVIGTTGNDTIVGVFGGATGDTFTVADSIDGGQGTDTLELIAQGTTASPAAITLKNVESVTVKDMVGSTVSAMLFENTPAISFTNTVAAQTSTVTGAALASVIGLQGGENNGDVSN
jgi:hypothetical protein